MLAAACGPAPAVIAPAGPPAARIATLWWILLAVGGLIWLGVMLLLGVGLWRRARSGQSAGPDEPPPPVLRPGEERGGLPGRPLNWVVGGGVVMPVVVLVGVYALALGTMRAIPNRGADEIVIDVVGHQFWWEIRYPNHAIVTANEIHIPAGEPVTLRLTSADVIHSFWVPELHGKIDLNPGLTNHLLLQADQPGEYRGQCAEFCGVQHARMGLLVIAQTRQDFDAWVARQQQPAAPPTDEVAIAGQQVLLGSACVYCHTVAGTNATGTLGPDLTHLAGRRTLAAVTVPNTRGHLAGWIIDPQALKPGNKMPPTNLSAEELLALLAYLETLD
jgi:cytochrome c oxidase subunit 2